MMRFADACCFAEVCPKNPYWRCCWSFKVTVPCLCETSAESLLLFLCCGLNEPIDHVQNPWSFTLICSCLKHQHQEMPDMYSKLIIIIIMNTYGPKKQDVQIINDMTDTTAAPDTTAVPDSAAHGETDSHPGGHWQKLSLS